MPQIEESVPAHLVAAAEAARASFSADQGSEFKVTGIVDPPPADGTEVADRDLQLILCGQQDGQDVCLRERFAIAPSGGGFEVERLESEPDVGSPAPELDPPVGVRARWLDETIGRHAFTVLLFYRGFW